MAVLFRQGMPGRGLKCIINFLSHHSPARKLSASSLTTDNWQLTTYSRPNR